MNIFDLQATISLNGDGFESGIKKADKAFAGLGDTVSAGAVMIGNILSDMAQAAVSKLGDFARAVIDTGTSFDSSMANVAAISGATGDTLDALRDKAKEMGTSTKFTATEAADAFSYMAMAGWDAEQMMDGITGIMNLAAASGEDLATTSDIVTDALTAFGLQAEDSGHFADVLAAASSAANTNVSMMGETFKYVAPLAGTMGYSVEDMATAIGTMANSGIKGSQAGTALRAALTRLVKPTDDAAAAMAKLGLDGGVLTDADGNMRAFSEVVGVLREAFSGLDASTQAETAALLFGQEAMSGMLAIINSSAEEYDALSATISSSSEAMDGMGTAAQMAATQLDNLPGQITIMQSALDGFKTAIYENLKGPLEEAAKIAAGVFSDLTASVNEGGILGAFTNLGSIIVDNLAPAFRDLTGFAQPVLDVFQNMRDSEIGGIIGDIANSAGRLFDAFKNIATRVITEIASGIKTFIAGFDNSSAIGLITTVADGAASLFSLFSETLGGVIDRVADAFSGFGSRIAELWQKAGPSLSDTFEAVRSVVQGIKTSVEDFLKFVEPVIEWLTSVFSVTIQLAFEQLLVAVGAAWNAIMNIVTAISDAFNGFVALLHGDVAGAAEAFKSAWENIVDFFQNIVDFIVEPFRALKQLLSDEGNKGVQAIKAPFEAAWSWFKDIGSQIVAGLKQGIADAWSGLTSWVTDKVSSLTDSVKNFFGIHSPSTVFAGIGENLVLGMQEGWGDAFGGLERQIDRDMASINGTAQIGFENSALGKSSAAGIAATFAAMDNGGRSGDPIQINLVLDGDVAATALYDPLRRTAFQRGQSMTEAGAYA